jgi:DNA-binding transcriptional MerR regulator
VTDDSDTLLPIGRFAPATGLSAKTLCHYAEIDLLRPTCVDPSTGCCYYAISQLPTAAAILRLRSFELPLAEIGALLDADEASRHQRLAAHRRTLKTVAIRPATRA